MDISTGGSALVHLACHVPFTGGTYGILVYLLISAIPTSGYRAGFYRQQVLRRGNAEKHIFEARCILESGWNSWDSDCL